MDVNKRFKQLYEIITKNKLYGPDHKKVCKWIFIFSAFDCYNDFIDLIETRDRKKAYEEILDNWLELTRITSKITEELK